MPVLTCVRRPGVRPAAALRRADDARGFGAAAGFREVLGAGCGGIDARGGGIALRGATVVDGVGEEAGGVLDAGKGHVDDLAVADADAAVRS